MREIKFRAWDGNRYISHDSLCCPSYSLGEILYGSGFIVEQFTGLHDKNGKEIYQNDICKIKFDVNKVDDHIYNSLTKKEIETGERVFLVESPMFNNQPELNADVIDIIGNIHENPELLND
jgi:uncharacterized phage protein (TIGR01671 family)